MNREHETGNSCSYTLSLADGTAWAFTATDRASAWLHQFARIIGLRPGSENFSHKLIFSAIKDINAPAPPPALRTGETGWQPFQNAGNARGYQKDVRPGKYGAFKNRTALRSARDSEGVGDACEHGKSVAVAVAVAVFDEKLLIFQNEVSEIKESLPMFCLCLLCHYITFAPNQDGYYRVAVNIFDRT